jgi:hypothetical protein
VSRSWLARVFFPNPFMKCDDLIFHVSGFFSLLKDDPSLAIFILLSGRSPGCPPPSWVCRCSVATILSCFSYDPFSIRCLFSKKERATFSLFLACDHTQTFYWGRFHFVRSFIAVVVPKYTVVGWAVTWVIGWEWSRVFLNPHIQQRMGTTDIHGIRTCKIFMNIPTPELILQ